MTIRLDTLGGFRAHVNGVAEPKLARQPLRCSLLLHVANERRTPRERVLGMLWREGVSDRARRRRLNQMLFELRRDMGRDYLVTEGDDLVASPDLTTDALLFRRSLDGGDVDEALRLYRGPFLDTVRLADTPAFDHWTEEWRARLADLYRRTQRDRVAGLIARHDVTGALGAARRWVLAEPLEEEAQLGLLRLLARSGLRNEVIRQYEDYRRRLSHLGAEPLAEMVGLVEDVRRGEVEDRDPAVGLSQSAPQLDATAGVVVLPFEDMSPEGDYGHFCDGLAEEIIFALGKLPRLRIIPRTSAFALRGERIKVAAEALGVTHAIEGSARFSSESYRITLRLIEARKEDELWREQLNGRLESRDIFDIQDRIAGEVSKALRSHLGAGPPEAEVGVAVAPPLPARRSVPNMDAYRQYLRGRKAWYDRSVESLYEALEYFEGAIASDPSYAPAYCGIADVHCLLGAFDYGALPPSEAFGRAREAAERALELDPESSGAHAALGNVLGTHLWDFAAGEECYRTAIRLDPGNSQARQWHSDVLLYQGRVEESLAEAVVALELDPRSAHVSSHLARHYQLHRQPKQALEQYKHALSLDAGLATAHMGMALTELSLGDTGSAIGRLSAAAEVVGDRVPMIVALLGYALGVSGDADQARQMLKRVKRARGSYLAPEHVALVYLGLGEWDRAVTWLERAFEAGSQIMTLLRIEPIADPVREHPAFQKLIHAVESKSSGRGAAPAGS